MASAALAQTTPAPVETQDPDEAAQIEEVVVTATRLRPPDYVASNPVVSVRAETIQYSGVTNVTDLLFVIPALANSFNSVDSADTGGSASVSLSLLELRKLGTQRTLVLVNGRRHVTSRPTLALPPSTPKLSRSA